ncbi:glycosyl hydrolase 115 family protein [Bacteroides nordii]|uniref:glycosyl hydrolase 115 family protein n=1 Tax=Bacteroides nordii TaxID=291645 RepID=UPI00241DBEC4|nr:glycosyl hydrolase 115 family protein [Bacteroides nordii]MBD9108753.1 hypothetical protein [Bacteroides nordii]
MMKMIVVRFLLLVLGCVIVPNNMWGFELVSTSTPLTVYHSQNEADVVHTAVNLFIDDMEAVSGQLPVKTDLLRNARLLIGTLGQESSFDCYLSDWNIPTDDIAGKWEAFKIKVVERKDVQYLLVLGSDARGTAYGVLELSRIMGVSPWYWWADVSIEKRKSCVLPAGYENVQSPSVQFRGFFINDEDWGLVPWSTKNFDPQPHTTLGTKTYEKVFELLLRLRANTLWPAMHGCSTPFYFIDGAREMADKYGIVMGTSHCEPLMRNTNGEWDKTRREAYNYVTNKEEVQTFWMERLNELKHSENIYTIGMRGVHDGKMQGTGSLDEQTQVLSQVIADQRTLLTQSLETDITRIPQAFMPYKEVLDIYNNGLKVPEDVTIVWCDDNYGYITRLNDKEEQKRKGGAGIYYHISYFGKPHDYLWLYSTQPALIYKEMRQAWDYGVRKLWILNVGDIKPAEYGIEFFLDMAWDINKVEHKGVIEYMRCWLGREFGVDCAHRLLPVMQEYYRLSHIRKPEHMGNTRVDKKNPSYLVVSDLPWSEKVIRERLASYDNLANEVEQIEILLPDYKRDAYFQLVKYPVQAAAQMNRKFLKAQLARHGLAEWEESDTAFDSIVSLTCQYNSLRNGKWNLMMDMAPRRLPVFKRVQQERTTISLRKESVPVYSFSGADYTDSFGQQRYCDGLGYSGRSLALRKGSSVSYRLEQLSVDSIRLEIRLLPNHPINSDKLRLSVAFNDSSGRLIEYQTKEKSEEWKNNVLRNQAIRWLIFPVDNSPHHILTLEALDEGIIVDQILVYDAREL